MPVALGGTFSPRRIIDPYASHYFAVPPAWFAFLVWRFCLRVLAGVFFLLLLPLSSLVAMWRLPSDPPLSTHLIVVSPTACGKRHVFNGSVAGVSYVGGYRSPRSL